MKEPQFVARLRKLVLQADADGAVTLRRNLQHRRLLLELDQYHLLELHDLLLLLIALPRDRAQLNLAKRMLEKVVAEVAARSERDSSQKKFFRGSGIAGAWSLDAFTSEGARWVAGFRQHRARFKSQKGIFGDSFDTIASGLLGPAADSVLHPGLTSADLLRFAGGKEASRQAGWVVGAMQTEVRSAALKDFLFDALEAKIEWRYSRVASQSFSRFPGKTRYFHHGKLKSHFSFLECVRRPLPNRGRLSAAKAQNLWNRSMGILTARNRETDPVTFAAHREILLFKLEGGVDVALYSLRVDRRLPLDSYVGFIAARNGVPMAYGGAWLLGPRAEIGINIFEPFRGADSSFLYAQIVRVYCQVFRVSRFVVPTYQFGEGNREAIASGAYWFYHRLGFRSTDETLAALAEKEVSALKKDPQHRTSFRKLERLTDAPLALDVRKSLTGTLDVRNIGLAVLDHLRRKYGSNLDLARRMGARWISRWGGTPRQVRASSVEQAYARDLAVVIDAVPGSTRWRAGLKKRLARCLLLKERPGELRFVRAAQKIPEFIEGLQALEARGAKLALGD